MQGWQEVLPTIQSLNLLTVMNVEAGIVSGTAIENTNKGALGMGAVASVSQSYWALLEPLTTIKSFSPALQFRSPLPDKSLTGTYLACYTMRKQYKHFAMSREKCIINPIDYHHIK